MAQADHFVDENLLLLVVETRKERLGGIGNVALILRPIVEELGLIAHLLDNVIRRIALGACNPQVQSVGAIMAEIMHGAGEPEPVLLLVGRAVLFRLDPLDIGVAGGHDLLGCELRLAALGQDLNLLGIGGLVISSGLGLLRALGALGCLRGLLISRWLAALVVG